MLLLRLLIHMPSIKLLVSFCFESSIKEIHAHAFNRGYRVVIYIKKYPSRLLGFFFLQIPSCSDTEVDQLFVVHWPAKDLGGYRRGLNATLAACHLTPSVAYGLYQCHLNRSRGSAVELWSALLQTMPTTIETVTSEAIQQFTLVKQRPYIYTCHRI